MGSIFPIGPKYDFIPHIHGQDMEKLAQIIKAVRDLTRILPRCSCESTMAFAGAGHQHGLHRCGQWLFRGRLGGIRSLELFLGGVGFQV